MRLIDADKLPYVNKVILVDDVDGDIIITIAKEHTSYANDETPTVKAIPIEWIEKRIEKLESEPLFFITDYEPVILEDLIADWEKENEQV